jgi:DNA helicase-2/ATP-dependent DNA helicase PcrA
MNNEFQAAYKLLNDAQRVAVDAVEGPVLVVAGPGTGKTQLLSTRVANILKTTDTKPGNVLCLTYTNKAAVNMKERIIKLAGQDGSKVPVKTFHSFAGEIMNLYPDYFWNAARLAVTPDSVQLEILESILMELPLDNPLALKFAGQYTLLSDIKRAISLTKDAGLTPDKLKALVEVNLAYIEEIEADLADILETRLSAKNLEALQDKIKTLPVQTIDANVYPLTSLSTVILEGLDEAVKLDAGSSKTANTGAWKKRWLQTVDGRKGMFDERRRNQWWLELAGVYASYLEQMHERGFYDYADMLVEVIAQAEQHSELLADLQERFSHVLIDEFQDTTPAQLRLAHLVADHHSAGGSPNLMVVGDDDQTIYKFSGAELNNMLGFKRRYPAVKIIVLTDNYRSTQAVLDSAKRVIEQAENRLVKQDKSLDKNLVAADPPEAGEIIARNYASRELEHSLIARDIQQRYRPDRSLAVLARGHDSLIKLAGILQQLGVPVRYEQQSNALDHEIVNQVYLIAQLLQAIQTGDNVLSNSLVHQIIRHPMWGIMPEKLWQLAIDNRRSGDWLGSLLSSGQAELRAIGEWFTWLAQQADSQPLAVTLEYLLGLRVSQQFSSPIKHYFVDTHTDLVNQYFHSLSAIQLLRALVHEFAKNNNEPSLAEFIRFIELNKINGLVVADESPFITGDHAVQLLTVHKAKGLEFDSVYIIDATEDNWQPRKGSRKPPANLPLQPAGDDADDYVRLMYVAVTRAKSAITIGSYYLNHAGKDVAMSPIIQTAFDVQKVSETDQSKLVEVLEENLRWPELSGGQEKTILQAKLETYSLSVTHLLNFLNVEKGGPRYFKERNLLYLPEVKSINMSYGTAMHAALETAQKLTNTGAFDLAKVIKDFTQGLAGQQPGPAEYQRFARQGEHTLTRLFNDYHYQLPQGSLPEQDFKDIYLGTARIRGKLDRLDTFGDRLSIIDYKTGRPLASFDTTDKTESAKAHHHKLQLTFYALLAAQHPKFSRYHDVEGQMVYVEAENQRELIRSFKPGTADLERLKSLVEAVWRHIMAFDLPDVTQYAPDLSGIRAFENDLIEGKI